MTSVRLCGYHVQGISSKDLFESLPAKWSRLRVGYWYRQQDVCARVVTRSMEMCKEVKLNSLYTISEIGRAHV